MAKTASRPIARHAADAVALLGRSIRRARIEHGMTAAELAERGGMSRGLVQRIEAGDPGCSVGAVFEAATIVGLPLFEADGPAIEARLAETRRALQLLPSAVRHRSVADDDF